MARQEQLTKSGLEDVKAKIRLYIEVGRFDSAEKFLKTILTKHGHNAALSNLLGTIYHRQSKFLDAIKSFRQAIKTNPLFLEAHLNLIACFCDLSQYDDANQHYAKLKGYFDPRYHVPVLSVRRLANQHAENGFTYLESGLAKEAQVEFEKALQLFAEMPDVQLALARIYIQQSEFEKAKKILSTTPSTQNSATAQEIANELGLVMYKLGRPDLAQLNWEQSARDSGDAHVAKTLLAAVAPA